MGESTIITDAHQLIVYANAAFAEATGYTSAEVVGLNCRLLQDDETDDETVANIGRALGAGQVFRGEILNRKKNGPLFWNSITIAPIRDAAGEISNFVSVQKDITARVLQERGDTVGDDTSSSDFAAGTLEMYMQPIIDLTDGSTVMVEALARLVMPDGRVVAAADFINGLSVSELESVFRDGLNQVLRHLVEWDAAGIHLAMSLNLDPATLANAHCARWVAAALEQYSVCASRLTLELLETRAVDSPAQKVNIAELRALGVKLAIDDLGTGHSNLQRLTHLPVELVKIDSSIVAGFAAAPVQTLSVIFALTQLSLDLGRLAVIEGVETLAMLSIASVLGAPLGQGYLFAHPMPAGEIPAWIATLPLRIDREHLTTTAAVLAYHWRHSRGSPHPGELSECPITRFLDTGAAESPLREWHASQHGVASADSAGAAYNLTNWLSALIEV